MNHSKKFFSVKISSETEKKASDAAITSLPLTTVKDDMI